MKSHDSRLPIESFPRAAATRMARVLGLVALLLAALWLPAARAQIYIVDGNLNGGGGGVSVFAPSASGNVLSDLTLAGASTNISNATGVAASATALYVLCNNFVDPAFVLRYSLPTAGNATPVSRTYLAASTGALPGAATAIAVDGTFLYVLEYGTGVGGANGSVNVYPLSSLTSNTSGSPLAATRTIAGGTTGLSRPNGLAVDGTSIYVANNTGNNLLIFALGADGNVAPTKSITGLNAPSSVAVDATTIYVFNFSNSRVTTYPVGTAGGAVAALTTLGSTSISSGAFYVGVDATHIYVGDPGDPLSFPQVPSVLAFPKATASTTATPSATISGTPALTALNSLVVLTPPGTAAPTVTTSGGSSSFTISGAAVAIDSGLTLTAVPSTLATGTIQLTTGWQSAQDALAFTNNNSTTFGNIAGVYHATLGILRLESVGATATKAQWQSALRAVAYTNTSGTPNTADRTVTFKVFDGAQTSSTASKTVTLSAAATAPGAPTIGTATAGNAQATVTFTAPVSNGGSAITGYTVTSIPAGGVDSNAGSTSLSHVITGLTNGTAYTFTVKAANAVGSSAASTASNSVTPVTVPGAPTIGTATAGNAQATVTFTAPASNGGSAITGYTVTSSPAGGTDSNAGSTGTSHVITGLTNGTAYTFTVIATNAAGSGSASSASNSVTPVTVPGAPTIGTATAGNAQATVTFTAPASNGGGAITGYTVTSSPAGGTDSNAGSTGTSHVITGLSNGTAYTFTVTAANSAGVGAASAASNSVTPLGAPVIASVIAPTNGTYKAGDILNFTVNLSQAVTVNGTPNLALTVGSVARNATYVSGSGTTALVFRYTVALGDNAAGGIVVASPVALNGGTIVATSGGLAATLTFTPPTTASVIVSTAPILVTTGGATAFSSADNAVATPVVVDGGLTLTDPSLPIFPANSIAVVTIGSNYQAGTDVLSLVSDAATMGGLGGGFITTDLRIFDIAVPAGSLLMGASGVTSTVEQWQAALRAVKFTSTAATPNTADRTLTFKIYDGVQLSNTATKTITVTAARQSPAIATSSGSTLFPMGGNALAVDSRLTVSDADSATLASAQIAIVNFQGGNEFVAFTNDARTMGNIASSYVALSGVPTLVLTSAGATATLAQWQAALRAVTYTALNGLGATDRSITFVANDGAGFGVVATKTVAVRLAPAVSWTPAALVYGTPLGDAQLNASATFNGAPLPGSFTYTPAAGTILGVGAQTLSATFTPTDTATYNNITASSSLTVSTAPTQIAVAAASAKFTGASQPVTLSATVTSTAGSINVGTVTFTLVNADGGTIGTPVTSGTVAAGAASATYTLPSSITAGTFIIRAAYNGAGSFASSSNATQTLAVGATATTITVAGVYNETLGGVFLSATVKSSAGTINEGTITFTLKNSKGETIGTPVTSGALQSGGTFVVYNAPFSDAGGTYTIQAVYNPPQGGSFATSTDASQTVATSFVTRVSAEGDFVPKVKAITLASGLTTDSSHRLAIDRDGNLYRSNLTGTITKITPRGVVSEFARGLSSPSLMTFDSAGLLHVLTSGGAVYSISSAGTPTLFANIGNNAVANLKFDPTGKLTFATGGDDYLYRVSSDKSITKIQARLNGSGGVLLQNFTWDRAGNLKFMAKIWGAFGDSGSIYQGNGVNGLGSNGTEKSQVVARGFYAYQEEVLLDPQNDQMYVVSTDNGRIQTISGHGVVEPYFLTGEKNGGAVKDRDGYFYFSSGDHITRVGEGGMAVLSAKVTSSGIAVNSGTVTFTLLDGSTVVGTPVTVTVVAGSAQTNYPIPVSTGAAVYTIRAVYTPSARSAFTSGINSPTLRTSEVQRKQILFGFFAAASPASSTGRKALVTAETSLAALINDGGSSGVLVGYLSSLQAGFKVNIAINDDNTFTGQTVALLSGNRTGQSLTFNGRIADGVMTGTVVELGLTFTAQVDAETGSSANTAGLYQASSLNPGGATTYTIIGTQGQVFALAVTPAGVSAGLGTVANDGVYSVTTNQGASIAGAVNAVSGSTSSTITSGGTTTSLTGLSSATPVIQRLGNLSLLGTVGGGQYITAGFVVSGGSKPLLTRGIGPSLSQFGVAGVQGTPTLTLFDGAGQPIVSNSGWAGDSALDEAFSSVGAFSLPATSRDAAAMATLNAGAYTIQITGGSTAGQVLAEIYDLAPTSSSGAVINLSALGPVVGNSTLLEAGFVVSGNTPSRVLIRGIGPSLGQFGVANTLATPLLKLFDGTRTVIAQNQVWGTPVTVGSVQAAATASEIVAAAASAGAFPLTTGSNDSSMVLTLAPGSYTVHLSGANNASGAALIEIYEVR